MNDGSSLLNLILLVVAIVVFLKLRSVLGRRTGHERPPYDPYSAPEQQADGEQGNVINLPGAKKPPQDTSAGQPAGYRPVEAFAPEGSPLAQKLTELSLADRRFDPENFMAGARIAYEMIVTAFAAGDRDTLQPILGRDVFDSFDNVISGREARGETVEMSFVGLRSADLTDAGVSGDNARVTVRFVSELTSSTKNSDGVVIEGDPVTVREITDLWTFERSISSSNPNWQLVATGVAN